MNNDSLSREQQEAIRRIREREARKGGIIERRKTNLDSQAGRNGEPEIIIPIIINKNLTDF